MDEAQREEQRKTLADIGAGLDMVAAYRDITSKESELVTLDHLLDNFVFLTDGSRVADIRLPWATIALSDFHNTYKASIEAVGKDKQGNNRYQPVTDAWMQHPGRKKAYSLAYEAGKGLFIDDSKGNPCLNVWRPKDRNAPPENSALLAKPFFDHVRWLFKDRADDFIRWLAHIEQKPGELPHTGWLHIAPNKYGLGRNWISSVLTKVWAGNVAPCLDMDSLLNTGFNDSLGGKVLAVVDEIRAGGNDKWNHSQKLKSLVTAESREINPKYGRKYIEKNSCRWLLFSNHKNALPLEDDDRRWEVVICNEARRESDYYKRLYQDLLPSKDFIAAVADQLLNWNIEGFNPGDHAKRTAHKTAVVKSTRSEISEAILRAKEYWPDDIIYSSTLFSIAQDALGDQKLNNRQFANLLLDADVEKWDDGRRIGQKGRLSSVLILRNAEYWLGTGQHEVSEILEDRLYIAGLKGAVLGSTISEYLHSLIADREVHVFECAA